MHLESGTHTKACGYGKALVVAEIFNPTHPHPRRFSKEKCMKNVVKILAIGAVLAASSSFAFADQVSLSGGDTFTNTTIDFTGPFLATGETGIFAGLTNVTFITPSLIYTTPAPFPVPGGLLPVFTVSNNSGVSDTFFVSSATPTLTTYKNADGTTLLDLEINGLGEFTGSNISGSDMGSFTITTQGEPAPNGDISSQVSFSGTGFATAAAVTPEPNSLLLMGTGLLGAAGLLFSRRRNANNLI